MFVRTYFSSFGDDTKKRATQKRIKVIKTNDRDIKINMNLRGANYKIG